MLPVVEPHFGLAPLLVDADVRAAYEEPATLEQPEVPPGVLTDSELHAVNVDIDDWPSSNPPSNGRACDRLPPEQLEQFLRALDDRGMLFAGRDRDAERSGFFCVRKEWDSERNILFVASRRRARGR